jgi:phenylalanyl-tRNA synthetase beta chain
VRFDVDWLSDHLERTSDLETLAERLTACGCLVELREEVGGTEVWDVEVTTNRPDVMNHYGLAREAAVATGVGLKPIDVALKEEGERASELATVDIVEPELCTRYVARIVRGASIVESPDWLRRRLERCGVRPINAVVDVTNYVLLDLGQPLHAFDLKLLAGRTIIVRRAVDGEALVTLDGVTRALTSADLVIADAERAVALAGIMGGASTEIDHSTTEILIESAHFDPLTVRRSSRRLGMHTEASHRFERGSDPEIAGTACDAAAALIAQLTGGRVCRGRIDAYPKPWTATTLSLDVTRLSAFAGLEIADRDVMRILDGLGFDPKQQDRLVTVTPPSHRVDVERVPDLYEEVIRHVGYDAVPSQLPVLPTPPGRRHPNWQLVDRGRSAAVAVGLTEVITWSFIDPVENAPSSAQPLVVGDQLALDNPLAATQATLRRSLLPGMLTAARENLNRGERSLALFEQGRVFWSEDGTPHEGERLGVVLSGSQHDDTPTEFADIKGIVEAILDRVGYPEVGWHRGGSPWLAKGEGAVLITDGQREVGYAGRLDPALAERWQLKRSIFVAELDLEAALTEPPPRRFVPLPRFPSVVADMTIEHDHGVTFMEMVDAVRQLAGERVEQVELQARYTGDSLAPGVVRTTLRLVYRHPERSLTQDEVNLDQTRLRERMAEQLGVRFA